MCSVAESEVAVSGAGSGGYVVSVLSLILGLKNGV